jgi:hypothetical protein
VKGRGKTQCLESKVQTTLDERLNLCTIYSSKEDRVKGKRKTLGLEMHVRQSYY